jgi:5-methylcytosine-specific restriction endonuclease McrA
VRQHKLTHPVFGPVTWRGMQSGAMEISRGLGRPVCAWCLGPVPRGNRTRCGNAKCAEMIWQAQSWSHTRQRMLHAFPLCPCGKRAVEVDHKVPVSMGGTGDAANLRTQCHDCHRLATNRLRKEKAAYVA